MSIEEQLTQRLKDAMRSKNTRELEVLRMVKTQVQVAKTAPGFDGNTDDAFYVDVIGKYVKQQQRAMQEFEKVGDAGKEHAARLQYEIDYFAEFLPKKLDEAALRALVRQAVAETGAVGAKMAGKVMGHIMKSHKDSVEADSLKRMIAEVLGA